MTTPHKPPPLSKLQRRLMNELTKAVRRPGCCASNGPWQAVLKIDHQQFVVTPFGCATRDDANLHRRQLAIALARLVTSAKLAVALSCLGGGPI